MSPTMASENGINSVEKLNKIRQIFTFLASTTKISPGIMEIVSRIAEYAVAYFRLRNVNIVCRPENVFLYYCIMKIDRFPVFRLEYKLFFILLLRESFFVRPFEVAL